MLIGLTLNARDQRAREDAMSEERKEAEAKSNPAGVEIEAQAEIIEEAIGMPRMLSSCGHALSEAKYAGSASWQNRWRCNVCGKFFSR